MELEFNPCDNKWYIVHLQTAERVHIPDPTDAWHLDFDDGYGYLKDGGDQLILVDAVLEMSYYKAGARHMIDISDSEVPG